MPSGKSIFGNGLSVPLGGWPPASNCIEIEMTRRVPLGQNRPAAPASFLAARGAALLFVPPLCGVASPFNMAPAAKRPTPALARVRKVRRPVAADSLAAGDGGCLALL